MKRDVKRMLAAGLVSVATAGVFASGAQAFPTFSDCPLRSGDLGTCIDIESPSGSINIKGFNVPLSYAIEIRGAVRFNADGSSSFVPPAGTNGVFGRPTDVPGGLLGIDLPFYANKVTATAQLAGSPSDVAIDISTLTVSLPIKLKLSNIFLNSSCSIGTNSNPARLNLITGTTSPPAPNRPITGRRGTISVVDGSFRITGNTNVDNSFAVPSASGCGLFNGGLIDSIVNLKMKLPSAAGNNTMIVNNNVATRAPQ